MDAKQGKLTIPLYIGWLTMIILDKYKWDHAILIKDNYHQWIKHHWSISSQNNIPTIINHS